MPWDLDIHQFDVGQGDSSVVVARDTAGANSHALLIDGGLAQYGRVIDDKLQKITVPDATGKAVPVPIDTILATHFDKDHLQGLLALLIADNLEVLCLALAGAAARQPRGSSPAQTRVGFCAAVVAVLSGCTGAARAGLVDTAATKARAAIGNTANPSRRAQFLGVANTAFNNTALENPEVDMNSNLTRAQRNTVAMFMADNLTEAVTTDPTLDVAKLTPVALEAARAALRTKVPLQSRSLHTGGRYRSATVLDAGQQSLDADQRLGMPANWPKTIDGWLTVSSNYATQIPGIDRTRQTPELEDEILLGVSHKPWPVGAPAAVVTAVNQRAWPKTNALYPPSGQPANDVCIGVVIVLGGFFYFTAGDLPWQGENVIATGLLEQRLPQPGSNSLFFPQATRISAFKCGHHGSSSSTSALMLQKLCPAGASKKVSAFISAGNIASFGHPTQAVIDLLQLANGSPAFYMTNCNFPRNYVPASQPTPTSQAQARGKIAGDNNDKDNLAVGRNRGDLRLRVTAQAAGLPDTDPNRRYTVEYWNQWPAPKVNPGLTTDSCGF